MTTAWAHLPNAKHLDRVLAHCAAHPEAWRPHWDSGEALRRATARTAARLALAALPERDDIWTSVRTAAWERGATDAPAVLFALVAWDHAGELLDLPLDELEAIAKLGVPAAVMVVYASRAFNHSTKEPT